MQVAMKKNIFYVFAFLFFHFSVRSFAQDSIVLRFNYPQKIHTIIKTNPFAAISGPLLFTGEYRLLTEFTTAPHQSTQLGVGYLGKGLIYELAKDSFNLFGPEKLTVRGFRVQASHKIYPFPRRYSPKGFYFSPQISYAMAKISTKSLLARSYYVGESNFNINMLIGAQVFLGRTMAFDFFCGLGYKNVKYWEQYQSRPRNYVNIWGNQQNIFNSHLKITLGLNIGLVTKKIRE